MKFLQNSSQAFLNMKCWSQFLIDMKAAERKHRSGDSTHMQEIEIFDNQNFPKSFQNYLGNSNSKLRPGEIPFLKMESNITERFNLLSNQLFGKS